MRTQDTHRFTLEVRASDETIPRVRRVLAARLREWGLDTQIGPVCRGTVELLANVARHVEGDRTCVVEVRWTGRRLVASVADRDPRLPRLTSAGPVSGGLAAVALLSDGWGTCATETGKVIWFGRRVARAGHTPLDGRAPYPATGEFRRLPRTAGV
ncbi:ATP-binding protein [Streptomyces sp. NPDC000594]|uniref:ATP-binding protein n=1 Tax=Streptomyces sp. NPDC000594 TaxID=3154261 RepID=UPI00332A4964